MRKLLISLIVSAAALSAQNLRPAVPSPVNFTLTNADPSGSCNNPTVFQFNFVDATIWGCQIPTNAVIGTWIPQNSAANGNVYGDIYVDGVTYPNLNAAFTSVAAKPSGGIIRLSSGTYAITSQLTEPEQGTGVSIVGAGSSTTTIQANSAMAAMLYKADTVQSQFTIRGVTFQCSSGLTVNAQRALQLVWLRGGLLDDVRAQNCGTEDITIGGGATGHQTEITARDIQTNYDEGIFSTPGGGSGGTPPNIGIHFLVNTDDSTWDNVRIRNAHVEGLKIDAGASGNTFLGLHSFGYSATGILPYAPSYTFEDAAGGNQFVDLYCDGDTVSCFHFSMTGGSANDVISGGKLFWVNDGTVWPSTANIGTLDQQYNDWSVRNMWVGGVGLQSGNTWTIAGTPTAQLFGNRIIFDNIFGTGSSVQAVNYYYPTQTRTFNFSNKTRGADGQFAGSFTFINTVAASGLHRWDWKDLNAVELGYIDDAGGLFFPTLNIGSGSQFKVDSSGNITKLNNVTTSWPSSNSAGYLQNDGSGNLTWALITTAIGIAPSTYTVSTLPATHPTNLIAKISDGTSMSDCTTGSGTVAHSCQYNGSAWVTYLPNHSTYFMGGPFTVALSSATFVAPGASAASTTEASRQIPVPENCQGGNLFFITSGSQSGTGSLVATVRRSTGGVTSDSTVVATAAASAGAGNFSDTTHTQDFLKGDLITVRFTNNATVTSASVTGTSMTCSY